MKILELRISRNFLFRFILAAALVAMVGTVVVELDFDVGFYEFTITRQAELHVLDVQATGYPHALVIRLYSEK